MTPMPMDPMSQYDPATEALITQQTMPRQRVAQAMMGQQQGMGGVLQALMKLGMMNRSGTKPMPTAGGPGTMPVTTPGLSTNFNNFGMGGG